MKTIKIKRVEMYHFRGFTKMVVDFGDEVTNIYGGNGTGKSTIRNAFLWCLFGRDAEGRTNFEIKHRDESGETADKVDATVRITLDVDGRKTVLERTLREVWSKRRGETEEVYTGNETVVSVNEVPMNVTQYREKVEEIVTERLFELITTPEYFLTLPWKEQRAILFDLVGGVEDADVAERRADFATLLDELAGKSLEEYKREIAAKKRKAREELEGVQPRIDQTEKLRAETTPEISSEKATARAEEIDKRLEELEERLSEEQRSGDEWSDKLIIEKKEQLLQLRERLSALAGERRRADERAREELRERRERASGIVSEKAKAVEECRRRLAETEEERQVCLRAIDKDLEPRLGRLEADVERLRGEYRAISSEEWTGEEVCPTCKQRLPEEQIERARELYNGTKLAELEELKERGAGLNAEKDIIRLEIETKRQEIEKLERERESRERALATATSERKSAEEAYRTIGEVKPIPESEEEQSITAEISGVEADIEQLRAEGRKGAERITEPLRAEVATLRGERRELDAVLAGWKSVGVYEDNIEWLEKEGKRLASLIAGLEEREEQVANFTRAKVEAVEERINGAFERVRFRLYSYTIEGSEQETCIPLIDGIPYAVANTAGQMNAGLDVIRVICEREGVRAPIFIDNRERVTELIPMEGHQIVNLRVTEEKRLRVETASGDE